MAESHTHLSRNISCFECCLFTFILSGDAFSNVHNLSNKRRKVLHIATAFNFSLITLTVFKNAKAKYTQNLFFERFDLIE